MLLGVVLHSANLFETNSFRAVHLGAESRLCDFLIAAIHSFRMQTFFLIAGFAGAAVMQVRGTEFFARRRLLRLGVPFLATMLTLNTAEVLLEGYFHGMLRAGVPNPGILGFLAAHWSAGNLKHLWFLPTLMLYSLALILVDLALRHCEGNGKWKCPLFLIGDSDVYVLLLPLLMIPIDVYAWRLVRFWEPIRWTQLPSPESVCHYFPFFVFGYVAQRLPLLWSRFGETRNFYLLANGGLLITIVLSLSQLEHVELYSEMVRDNLAAFVLIGLTIRFARRILDRESLPLLGSPDIAYSVYLVHHVIIIGVAVVLVRFAMPPLVQFVAITCLAAALSLAAASVIRRYSVLRFLFNGRPMGA